MKARARAAWLLALCIIALSAAGTSVGARPYPGQRVRIIVPFSAGSVTDLRARLTAEKLSEIWQQQVIVENRPGLTGTASVAKSAPDGYTLLLTSNGHTVLSALNKNLP